MLNLLVGWNIAATHQCRNTNIQYILPPWTGRLFQRFVCCVSRPALLQTQEGNKIAQLPLATCPCYMLQSHSRKKNKKVQWMLLIWEGLFFQDSCLLCVRHCSMLHALNTSMWLLKCFWVDIEKVCLEWMFLLVLVWNPQVDPENRGRIRYPIRHGTPVGEGCLGYLP